MGERKRYTKTCPFCGVDCENVESLNLLCGCNAKYYYFDKVWLDRNTGKKVLDKENTVS